MANSTEPTPEFTYRVHYLPKDDFILLSYLAGKSASLKLNAVQVEKAAFSANFELEAKNTFKSRISRLKLPHVNTFIAISYPYGTPIPEQTVDRGDFIGCATLLGPLSKVSYEYPECGGPIIGNDDEETKWHMTGVYSNPNHRGHGVGKLLINSACEFAVEQSEGKASRVRANIHPSNVKALDLYYKLGFERAGTCNRFEAVGSNEEELPERETMDPNMWFYRNGPILERTTQKM